MKVLIVCVVLIGVTMAAPYPAKKKEVKGYEVKKTYHSQDGGYGGDHYGPYPDKSYGNKDYKRVEVKKYGYEQEKDAYAPHGYRYDDGKDDKGYYAGYEREEYRDNDGYRSHGYNDDKYVVNEKRYYGKYDNDRDYYPGGDGYNYGGDYNRGYQGNAYNYKGYGDSSYYGNHDGYRGEYGYPYGGHGDRYNKFNGY